MRLSKNNLFCFFICIFLVFGVVLYDTLHFNYTDEILTLLLAFLAFLCVKKEMLIKPNKELINIYILFGIFSFYLLYSFFIQSNTNSAIVQDFVVQLKPFLAFFATLFISPKLNNKHKSILKITSFFCFIFLIFTVLYGLVIGNLEQGILEIIGHPSRFATSVTACAFVFLYSSNFSNKNLIIFTLLFSIGLFSLKTKFYGFYILCLFIFFFFKKFNLKFRLNTILIIIPIIFLVVYFSFDKINYYFVVGGLSAEETFARPALYNAALSILNSYFPFGSGFASFATYFSGVYYSNLYSELGLDKIWGLSSDHNMFISDTYFPALAQFGVVGVVLFFYFFYNIATQANKLKKEIGLKFIKEYTFIVLFIFFFFIESIADSTFTHNRGVFMMILMAISLIDLKSINTKTENDEK